MTSHSGEKDSSAKDSGTETRDTKRAIVPAPRHSLSISRTSLVSRGLAALTKRRTAAVTLLVVDDLEEMRVALRNVFENDKSEPGIAVQDEAETGGEGLRKFKEARPDLVLTNITMPAMDGLTMAQEILQYDPSAKILFVSANGSREHVNKAVEIGARGFLPKPVGIRELIDVIYLITGESNAPGTFYFGTKGYE